MIKKLLSFTLAALTAASVSSSLASFGTANVRSLLKEDSLVVYDEDLGYLKGIFPDTAVKAFKSNFISDITVKDASGNAASDDAPVGTDFTVTADGAEFKTLVYGDVNRDGKVDTKDVIFMIRKSIGWDIDANMTAFDVNRDRTQNSKDIITVIRKLVGWNLELGYSPFRADTSKIDAPNEDESLLLTFGGNTEKLNAEADTANGRYSYVMELAKRNSARLILRQKRIARDLIFRFPPLRMRTATFSNPRCSAKNTTPLSITAWFPSLCLRWQRTLRFPRTGSRDFSSA